MSSKLLFLILFFLLLSGIMGFIYVLQSTKSSDSLWTFSPNSPPPQAFTDNLISEQEQAENTKIYNAAIESKDIKLCQNIGNDTQRNRCKDMVTIGKALEERSLELCNTLTLSGGLKDTCLDTVSYRTAEVENDISQCKKIQDENIRGNCEDIFAKENLEIAISSGSLSADDCDSFSSIELQDQCRSRLQQEVDMRIYRESLEKKSMNSCSTIGDDDLREKCLNSLLLEKALGEGDIEICSTISDDEKAIYCKKTLESKNDVRKYQKIISSGDLSACKTLTVPQMAKQCHDTLVFTRVRLDQDDELCATLYNTGIVDRCHALIRK